MSDIWLDVDVETVEVDFGVDMTVDTEIELDAIQVVKEIHDPYTGEYEVTPSLEETTVLETSGKTMLDDVTVNKIPVHKTRNQSGGYTIFVAESVE